MRVLVACGLVVLFYLGLCVLGRRAEELHPIGPPVPPQRSTAPLEAPAGESSPTPRGSAHPVASPCEAPQLSEAPAGPVSPDMWPLLSDRFLDQVIAEEGAYLGVWAPSREALEYWVFEYHLDQIQGLSGEKVLGLLEGVDRELFASYLPMLEGEEPLGEILPWPGREEVERLWSDPEYRAAFDYALVASNRLALVEMALIESPKVSMQSWREAALARRAQLQEEERQAWSRLWATDSAYPHWEFLGRVAYLYF